MSIQVNNLSHIYAQNTVFSFKALEDIDFEIGAHEFIGIIGHTGSGKSTLIQHLNRLLSPTTGTVVINGKDINDKNYPMREICKRVGIVFQYPEHQLFEETVFRDVAFGPRNIGVKEEEIEERVRESLTLVGLDYDNVKDASPFDLSGGQKRRVAIAGVVAMKPQILVLDEPASGLDPMGRTDLLENIKKLNTDLGICVLLVSHNMEDVAEYSDRVMVFANGKLEMFDTPEKVFAKAEFLHKLNLNVPEAKKVLNLLKERGFDVNTHLYKTQDAIKEILRVVGEKTEK